jgi:hypothetical protein
MLAVFTGRSAPAFRIEYLLPEPRGKIFLGEDMMPRKF